MRIPYACLPGGRIIPVAEAVDQRDWYLDYGCISCGGALRLHRQRVPTGPRDHFEHVAPADPNCPLRRVRSSR